MQRCAFAGLRSPVRTAYYAVDNNDLQVVAQLHKRFLANGELCTEADSWYRRHPRHTDRQADI